MLESEPSVSMEVELQWYKALVADLQHKLDEKERLLCQYEALAKDVLGQLHLISKGVRDASKCEN